MVYPVSELYVIGHQWYTQSVNYYRSLVISGIPSQSTICHWSSVVYPVSELCHWSSVVYPVSELYVIGHQWYTQSVNYMSLVISGIPSQWTIGHWSSVVYLVSEPLGIQTPVYLTVYLDVVNPLSYISFCNWYNKSHGMHYPVSEMVHIKEPLRCSLSLSEWSYHQITIQNKNEFSALFKKFPSFLPSYR